MYAYLILLILLLAVPRALASHVRGTGIDTRILHICILLFTISSDMNVIALYLFFHNSYFGNEIKLSRTDPGAFTFCRFFHSKKDLFVQFI